MCIYLCTWILKLFHKNYVISYLLTLYMYVLFFNKLGSTLVLESAHYGPLSLRQCIHRKLAFFNNLCLYWQCDMNELDAVCQWHTFDLLWGKAHWFYGPGLCIKGNIIVSSLLLCNFWQEFNKILWEPSIPRDVHIFAFFRSDPLAQSYGPCLVMQCAYRAIIVSALLLCNYNVYWQTFNETL
jgi:hypothetical protein